MGHPVYIQKTNSCRTVLIFAWIKTNHLIKTDKTAVYKYYFCEELIIHVESGWNYHLLLFEDSVSLAYVVQDVGAHEGEAEDSDVD